MRSTPDGQKFRVGPTIIRVWKILSGQSRRDSSRGHGLDIGQAGQEAEFRAAQRLILNEAERQRGTPEGGRHRWYDGPTRLVPLAYHRAPRLTRQQHGYRCRG